MYSALVIVAMLIQSTPPPAAESADRPMFDLSKDKVLYCVGYAHLDTQWRWDFCTTIDRFVKDTLEQNFERFEKYPGYVFNFTGSIRYEMMREYYPELYERLKGYIADGRWRVSGSSVDEGDVNVPSAEAVIRHVLYGNQFFRREFKKESVDFMLPDCFGFPASMPSIWAHCGLKGFSTQKLTWGSAVGIPFKIGVWEGLDGNSIMAALDPGSYSSGIKGPVHTNEGWIKRINENGQKYGVFADYHYYGVGDVGGAPRAEDIENYLKSANTPNAPIKVALVSSDQLWKDITPEMRAKLPRYKGDLLLTEHSAGTLTSESYMKRWNRKNEQLADAAERAAVVAHWLGAAEYPREQFYKCWTRALANQMHDILPGTSIARAYRYSWNDELVALNGFADILTASIGAVSRALDTRAPGVPLIVYNPLAHERSDVVEATIEMPAGAKDFVRVFDPQGAEVPSQVLSHEGRRFSILFVANVPSISFNVFDVQPADKPYSSDALFIAENVLENGRYHVSIDRSGDVSSIIDKSTGRELLAAPHQLQFTHEKPANWPAWNMDWNDRKNPPIDALKEPVKVRIVERGPVRVALEIERQGRDSIVKQQVRLTSGGEIVEFRTFADWQSAECALKAAFPLTASNAKATYNWGMGTIERGNNDPTKYEVPSHEWFDLTDKSGEFGVSILEDSKFGSDKPGDNTLRLTLLYTPGVRKSYLDQHSQDWGRHDITYAVYGHKGDWREGLTEWQGRRLNQPLRVFTTADQHAGWLGKTFSFVGLNTDQIDIRALKLAEDSNEVIARVQEVLGRPIEHYEPSPLSLHPTNVRLVDGQEREIPPPPDGPVAMKAFTPRAFACTFPPPDEKANPVRSQSIKLAYDVDVVSSDADRSDGAFDAAGHTIPAEMLPAKIVSAGVTFDTGPTAAKANNAIACKGQKIDLPAGNWSKVHLLAAADEDCSATMAVGGESREFNVQSWTGFIGQWDDRVFDREFGEIDGTCEGHVIDFKPAFIKRDPVAWFCTHRHHPQKGNESYRFSYLYRYSFDVKPGATSLTLPNEPRIKVLAVSISENDNLVVAPAAPLYDDFNAPPGSFSFRGPLKVRHVYPPPPKPVYEGVDATGKIDAERRKDFAFNFGPALADDYGDQHAPNGVVFKFVEGPEHAWKPHPRSAPVNGELPRLNDGEVAQNGDDTGHCVWYDQEGRFYADLQKSVRVNAINTFSWHRSNRAAQNFSLWASNAEKLPDPTFAVGKDSGWTLLAVVKTKDLGEGGIHGSSVHTADSAPFPPYRWLLWVAEDQGEGTFFTEIDILADATKQAQAAP